MPALRTAVASRRRLRLAVVSPYPPHRCPTATYTAELHRALTAVAPELAVSICAIDRDRQPGAPPEVTSTIAVDDPTDYRRAARRLRAFGAGVMLIQYGPDAAGGPHGRHLLGLVDELTGLRLPHLVTVHDVRRRLSPDEADVITALCRRAAGVLVLSDAAARLLSHLRLVPADRIAVIPPGAPPELWQPGTGPVTDPALDKALSDAADGPLLSTIGPLGAAGGMHVAIAALAGIVRLHPDARYVVGDHAHSDAALRAGDPFRQALGRAVSSLWLDANVHLLDTGLSRDDVAALLRSTTVYLATDLDRDRTASTGLTYAVAAGCPVVSTDSRYARGLVTPDVGTLVPPGDPTALTMAVNRLLRDPARLANARAAAGRLRHRLSFTAAAEHVAGLARLVHRTRPVGTGAAAGTARRTRTADPRAA